MKPAMVRGSKSSNHKAAKFIAPGKLARVYGPKTILKSIGDSRVHNTRNQNHSLRDAEQELEHANNHSVGGVQGHTLIMHCGEDERREINFTEDSSFLDILSMCRKFIDIYSIGFKVTDGDGKSLRNDKDLLAMMKEHEGVEELHIYLDVDETAQPLFFKLPEENSSLASSLGDGQSSESRRAETRKRVEDSTSQLKEKKKGKNKSNSGPTSDVSLADGDFLDIGIEHDNTTEPVVNKRKRVRGPTFMPKVWGQPVGELKQVSFNDLGQPNDKETSCTLAHFLGTIARNGRYCPLHYTDWRKMPYSYKDEMLKIVKAKFNLPPGNEPYILKSINKKWKSWKSFVKNKKFNPSIPIASQVSNIPERVEDEQFKAIIEHWMSDKTKAISEKNKQTRANLKLLHRMGKKSYALVREAWNTKFGRYPTRAELFKECYFKVDDPRICSVIKEAVNQMEEVDEEDLEEEEEKELQPKDSNDTNCYPKFDDSFAKVMGKEKNGYVRMVGLGVSQSDVCGPLPSRDASYRLAMEYKEKYEALSAKVHGGSKVAQKSDHQNVPLSSSNNQQSSSTSCTRKIRVHSRVVLKSLENINEIVASGYVSDMKSVRVNGEELGSGWCEINVQCQFRHEVRLIKPYDYIQTIGDSLGAPIAWPLSLVALNESDD